MTKRLVLIITLGIAGALLGYGLAPLWQDGADIPQELRGVAYGQPRPVEAFTLTDHQQQVFDRQRFMGRWTFLFFGYTHCPDVCPYTLGELNHVHQRLSRQAPQILGDTQFVFVSVDHRRDSPESLAGYVGYFNPAFVGATGTREQIDTLTRALGVHYGFVDGTTPEDYLVEHSASVLLIGPQANVRGAFPAPHDPQKVAAQYLAFRGAATGTP